MKLKGIFIKNFLSYEQEQRIDLADKTVVVGENGSGKSNIVRIIDFIVSNAFTERIYWYQYPYWNTREKTLIYLDFELLDKEREYIRKFLMLSLASMHTNSDKELGDITIHTFYQKFQAIFENSFKTLRIGFKTDITNTEKLSYFLTLALNEKTNLLLKNPSSQIMQLIKKEISLEEISDDTDDTDDISTIMFNEIKSWESSIENSLSKVLTKSHKSEEQDIEKLLYDNLFEELFNKELKMHFNELTFDNIDKVPYLYDISSDFKLLLRDWGYKLEKSEFPKSLGQFLSDLIKKKIVILREDRGLIKKKFITESWHTPANVLTLEKVENELFRKATSPNPEEQSKFNNIKNFFNQLFDNNFEINMVLVSEDVELKKSQSLFIEPETNSYTSDSIRYHLKSGPKVDIKAKRPEIQFQDTTSGIVFDLKTSLGGAYEIIMVLSAIHGFDAETIILDEPGKTLHPSLRKKLRDYIIEDKEHSYLIVTHTSDLISEDLLESILRCSKDENGSNVVYLKTFFEREDITDKQSKYVDFLLDPDLINLFFSKGVIFVEGLHDEKLLTALKSSLEKKENQTKLGFSDKKKIIGWDIIRISGKDNSPKALNIAKFFNIPFILVCDFDAFVPNKGKISRSRIGRILTDVLHIKLDNTVLDNDKDKINELNRAIRNFAENEGIFSWEKDLENMIKNTHSTFTKKKWETFSFKDKLDLIDELISANNEEFIEFIKFLTKRNIIQA